MSLDIRTANCRADNTGLHITDCFISARTRKRGTLHVVPSGQGLFEVSFTDLHGNVIEEHDAATLDYMARLLKRKAGIK